MLNLILFIESINVFYEDDFISFCLLKYSSILYKLIFFLFLLYLYLFNFSIFYLFSLFFSNSSLFFLSINSISCLGFEKIKEKVAKIKEKGGLGIGPNPQKN